MEATNFRNLVKSVSGRDISSKQAEEFLAIFKPDLDNKVNDAVRSFIYHHFGTKSSND